ncbi:hypothetical protein B0H17DRAFT_1180101 [Mycena rosella]|uniref:Uncharacterized protein n=1 Tax=Mycena rosella TaxID=1033263 RepID=A0AAD7DFC0_MYCRO|nr:hypothetical protein B0H17DRAFT_1180101 [Mycena rosella]
MSDFLRLISIVTAQLTDALQHLVQKVEGQSHNVRAAAYRDGYTKGKEAAISLPGLSGLSSILNPSSSDPGSTSASAPPSTSASDTGLPSSASDPGSSAPTPTPSSAPPSSVPPSSTSVLTTPSVTVGQSTIVCVSFFVLVSPYSLAFSTPAPHASDAHGPHHHPGPRLGPLARTRARALHRGRALTTRRTAVRGVWSAHWAPPFCAYATYPFAGLGRSCPRCGGAHDDGLRPASRVLMPASIPLGCPCISLFPSWNDARSFEAHICSCGANIYRRLASGLPCLCVGSTPFRIPAFRLLAFGFRAQAAVERIFTLRGLGASFLLRRAREQRLKDEFDGNFDPERTTAGAGGRGEGDDGVGGRLAGSSIGGGVLTPFMAGVGAGHHQGQQQGQQQQHYDPRAAQYGGYETGSGAGLMGSTASGPTSSSHYPASMSASSPVSQHYPGAAGGYAASSAGGSSSGGGSPNPMGAKQREALGLGVANPSPHPNQAGGSGAMHMPMPAPAPIGALPNPHSPPDVVVHQDGGACRTRGKGTRCARSRRRTTVSGLHSYTTLLQVPLARACAVVVWTH